MLHPLLGVGCPAAVGFVNRVIAKARRKIVGPDGVADDGAVKVWVQRAIKFVGKLAAK